MSTHTPTHTPTTLPDLLRNLWQARSFIIVGLTLGMMLSIAVRLTAIPRYENTMIIAPAATLGSGQDSSVLGNQDFSAVRYMMQRVGISGATDFVRFESTYDGATVAQTLLEDPNILAGLQRDHAFKYLQTSTQWRPSTLSDYIERRVHIDPVGGTPLRTLRYDHANKAFGQYFLHHLHKVTDEHIRTKISTQASQRIQYLQQAIRETTHPEHRRALTSLLMEQERMKMLASIGLPYAAAVIEPPASSAKPIWPPNTLLSLCAAAIGALLGYVIFTMNIIMTEKEQPEQDINEWFKPTAQNVNENKRRRPLTDPVGVKNNIKDANRNKAPQK